MKITKRPVARITIIERVLSFIINHPTGKDRLIVNQVNRFKPGNGPSKIIGRDRSPEMKGSNGAKLSHL
jgi:hypothetical protein